MPARILIVFVTILLFGACGDDDAVTDPDPAPTVPDGGLGSGPYPVADLTVHYTNTDADLDSTYGISCQGDTAAVTGDDVGVVDRDACAALADAAVRDRLLDGSPPDQVCTQIYGGADVAEFTGMIEDQSVDARVSRENGCAIDGWDKLLVDLLPAPVGATPEPTPPDGSSQNPTPPPPDGPEAAIDAVDAYVAAIAAGDLERSWDLVAGPSQEALGGYEEFEALRSALAEGIGTWDNAEDRQEFAIPLEGAKDMWAVTLLGVVPLEGPPALAATSMLVYTNPGTVSPFENAFGDSGFISFEPPAGSELDAGGQIRFELPDTIQTTTAYLDDTPVDLQADPDTANGHLVKTEEPLATGPHALTVIAEGPDGSRTAIAAAYTIESAATG